MRIVNLLATSAIALALAAPAMAQSQPGASETDPANPSQMERSAPATPPAATPGTTTTDTPAEADKAAQGDAATTQGGFITQQAATQKMADDFIGLTVQSNNKKSVGKVSDLLVDDQNRIIGAVLSVGGFLGIGEKKVAVAWNELQIQGGEDKIAVVDLSEEQLKSAPEFQSQADQRAAQEAERRKSAPRSPAGPAGGAGGTVR